jgi:cell shape-determining protein MreD
VRYWIGGAIAFAMALLQTSSFEQFHVLGVAPNVMLVMLVAWMVVRGLDDVLPMVAVAGITMGFIGLQTPGAVLLALLIPVAGLGIIRELRVLHSDALLVLLFVVAASLVYETLLLAGVMATGGVFDVPGAFQDVVLPAMIVNAAIALPVYLVMRFARPTQMRRRLSY